MSDSGSSGRILAQQIEDAQGVFDVARQDEVPRSRALGQFRAGRIEGFGKAFSATSGAGFSAISDSVVAPDEGGQDGSRMKRAGNIHLRGTRDHRRNWYPRNEEKRDLPCRAGGRRAFDMRPEW
jgi:hypothetical protein